MSLILARNCKVRLTLNCHCAKCPVSSHILRDWISPNTIYKYLFLNQQWQCYLWQLSSQQLSFTHPHTYTRVPTVCMCTLICIKSDLSLLFSYPSLYLFEHPFSHPSIRDPTYPCTGVLIRQ